MEFNILGLSGYKILHSQEDEQTITLHIEPTDRPGYCPKNGCVSEFYKHELKQQPYADTTIRTKRVWLVVNRQRYKCRSCGETFFERLPHMAEHNDRFMTQRLVEYIERESLRQTFTKIADETGLSEKTIRNVFGDYVKRLDQEYRFITPTVLGIDEIHILGEPRCVLTDIENKTVLDFLRNRRKVDLVPYLEQIPNKERIEYVTMDMWEPYKDAVNIALPQAIVIIDKFHVVRAANKAMDRVRLQIRKDLSKTKRVKLKNERFALYKREENQTERDIKKIEKIEEEYPELYEAYKHKEEFFDIWDTAANSEEARDRYFVWKRSIPDEHILHYAEIIRFMENWDDVIYNYFDHPRRVTNAYTEGLNSLIRVANNAGRGYSFEVLRAKLLYTAGFRKQQRTDSGRRSAFSNIRRTNSDRNQNRTVDQYKEYLQHLRLARISGFHIARKVSFDHGVDFSTIVGVLEEGI